MKTATKNNSPAKATAPLAISTASASLLQFAAPIAAKNHFIKASFGGFQGAGKSRTSCEFSVGVYKDLKLTKPIMVLDNEKSSRFLIPFFKKHLPNTQVLIKDTNTLADVITAMDYLDKGEIGLLLIDSISKVWYNFVDDFKKKNNITFMTMQHWGQIFPSWQIQFSDRFVAANGSIVYTGRGGFTYDREEEERDASGRVTKKAQFVKSGVKMKIASETPFETDLNIWMEQEQELGPDGKIAKVWREAHVMKDRSALIDGKTFVNPTYKDFKPVIDFLTALPVGDIKTESSTQNLAPGENYQYKDGQNKKTIALEEIEGIFHALSLGKSNEALAIKVYILETLFKSPSWKAIELTDYDTLERGLNILKAFKIKYQEKKPTTPEAVKTVLNECLDEQFEFDKTPKS